MPIAYSMHAYMGKQQSLQLFACICQAKHNLCFKLVGFVTYPRSTSGKFFRSDAPLELSVDSILNY